MSSYKNSRSSRGYIVWSQVCLLVFIGICFVIEPRYFLQADQGGISNYGTLNTTIIPYTLAFLGAGVLMAQAARKLRMQAQLRVTLFVIAGEYLFVALTTYPYKLNEFFRSLHELSAQLLALSIVLVGLYWALLKYRDARNVGYAFVLFVGLVLGVLTMLERITLLYTAEILIGLGFGLILVHSINKINRVEKKTK